MTDFLQLHILTAYPPSNPNRDDLGRPKTAIVGGRVRQRMSSQAIKRALRTSPAFADNAAKNLGMRTQRVGELIYRHLVEGNVAERKARGIARRVAAVFGKLEERTDRDDLDPMNIRQLAFVSHEELQSAMDVADMLAQDKPIPDGEELAALVLNRADSAIDIAMFGRMLAGSPKFNRDAAVQVAHAFTTNAVDIEEDYFVAVDDLNNPAEDLGVSFVGERGFGAGVYYLYICVDRSLLLRNLDGNERRSAQALKALVTALATSSPPGGRNAFGHHVRAEFMLAEKGDHQPRSLASAFVTPVREENQIRASIDRLLSQRSAFANVYGQDWLEEKILHVGHPSSATLDDVANFASEDLR